MPSKSTNAGVIEGNSRVVQVGEVPLHVTEGGEGAPLLVLHPAGGAGRWFPYHAQLARRHRVIAPDHPGFARSPTSPQIDSVADIAFLYARLLDQLGIERVSVLGLSFGGWIAAELAVLDPRRIERLVLVNAIGLRIPDHPVTDLFAMGPPEKIGAVFADPQAAAALFPGEPDLEAIMAFIRDDTAFARYAWQPFCCNPKLASRLWRITSPTLVLLGARDRVVPRAHGELYSRSIANSRLQEIPSAGHALLLESLDEGVAAIEQFFAS
jgi:pimeloyl-ACP methyl ester carboxylesterase